MKLYPMIRNPFSRLDYVIADEAIHTGPCIVFNITVTGKGSAGTISVHDGDNVVSPLKLVLAALNNTTFSYNPAYGCIFDRGIFIDINTNMVVSVLWAPLPMDYRKSMLVESIPVELGEKQVHPMGAHPDEETLTHRNYEKHGPDYH